MDLQGTFACGRFNLSDPAFVTTLPSGGVMGPADIGAAAINHFFFITHRECNEFCEFWWARPK